MSALPFQHTRLGDLVCDPMADPQIIRAHQRAFQPRPDDVFHTSYMKSGTLWTLQIARLILNRGVPAQDGRNLFQFAPILEEVAGAELDRLDSPRLIHSHLPHGLLARSINNSAPVRYLVVLRDPRDVAVSMYDHLTSRITTRMEASWDTFLELFMAGQVPYGSWGAHALPWWRRRTDDRVLVQSFGARKRDPERAVREMATFLEVSLTHEEVALVVHASSLSVMKRDPLANGSWLERLPGAEGHLRSGGVGGWRGHFSPAQADAFDAWLADVPDLLEFVM